MSGEKGLIKIETFDGYFFLSPKGRAGYVYLEEEALCHTLGAELNELTSEQLFKTWVNLCAAPFTMDLILFGKYKEVMHSLEKAQNKHYERVRGHYDDYKSTTYNGLPGNINDRYTWWVQTLLGMAAMSYSWPLLDLMKGLVLRLNHISYIDFTGLELSYRSAVTIDGVDIEIRLISLAVHPLFKGAQYVLLKDRVYLTNSWGSNLFKGSPFILDPLNENVGRTSVKVVFGVTNKQVTFGCRCDDYARIKNKYPLAKKIATYSPNMAILSCPVEEGPRDKSVEYNIGIFKRKIPVWQCKKGV